MTYYDMLPSPRAAPERHEIARDPSDRNLPVHDAPVPSPPPGSSIAPVALPSLALPQPRTGAERPARLPGTAALAVLAAVATFAIGSVAFVVADRGRAQDVTSPAQAFPQADQAAGLLATPADARLPEPSSAAAAATSGGLAQPAEREGATTPRVGGQGRIAKLIVLPEIILRREPGLAPAPSADPKVRAPEQRVRTGEPLGMTGPASKHALR
jgi:hypothetical protein